MKKFTIELTEEQVRMFDETMCVMSDTMNDVDETRPGGIIPTPHAFDVYVPRALHEWQILHDFIMDEILSQTRDDEGEML